MAIGGAGDKRGVVMVVGRVAVGTGVAVRVRVRGRVAVRASVRVRVRVRGSVQVRMWAHPMIIRTVL